MAAAALARRFLGVWRFAGATSSRLTRHVLQKKMAKATPCSPCASLHVSFPRKGLEEFFDDPKNWGEIEVASGDSWTVEQLRGKSSEDLHKLWYVLLKERNMLLTLEQEAKRQRLPMPSPERLEKVETSMERMDQVIQEREDALRLLQTGQEKEWPGEWRYDFMGRIIWYTFREWPIPWHINAKHNKKRYYFLENVERFNRLRLEKYLRDKHRKINRERKTWKKLVEKFPHLATKSS
ncbi:large ribosomal subunit protein uL29m [Paroedura picta]|uniref:large ribosomal subunit protein uL29m n=1 Tax=Paroedura picta TaxID=143630 RepID=UPI0040561DBA